MTFNHSSVKEEIKVEIKMDVPEDDPEVKTDEPAEESKEFSDNLKDIVKVKCGHCEMVITKQQCYGHMRNQHPGLLKNFKVIKKVYHRYVWKYCIPLFNAFNYFYL